MVDRPCVLSAEIAAFDQDTGHGNAFQNVKSRPSDAAIWQVDAAHDATVDGGRECDVFGVVDVAWIGLEVECGRLVVGGRHADGGEGEGLDAASSCAGIEMQADEQRIGVSIGKLHAVCESDVSVPGACLDNVEPSGTEERREAVGKVERVELFGAVVGPSALVISTVTGVEDDGADICPVDVSWAQNRVDDGGEIEPRYIRNSAVFYERQAEVKVQIIEKQMVRAELRDENFIRLNETHFLEISTADREVVELLNLAERDVIAVVESTHTPLKIRRAARYDCNPNEKGAQERSHHS